MPTTTTTTNTTIPSSGYAEPWISPFRKKVLLLVLLWMGAGSAFYHFQAGFSWSAAVYVLPNYRRVRLLCRASTSLSLSSLSPSLLGMCEPPTTLIYPHLPLVHLQILRRANPTDRVWRHQHHLHLRHRCRWTHLLRVLHHPPRLNRFYSRRHCRHCVC
jgi:hypothetical protein